jgi:beta-lactam-binding protein with PASTA domain
MRNFLGFLKSKAFLKHLGIAVAALVLFFWLIFKWLDVYTHHGKTVLVPDFNGLKISALNDFVAGKQLKFQVIDSIYDNKKERGIVIKQEPAAGARVKQERTIYLYVSSVVAPRVPFPDIMSRSLRQAVSVLETYNLKLAKPIKHRPDICNCVVGWEFKGKQIKPGTQIEKGSEITLIMGEGHGGSSPVNVPNLLGLTLDEAYLKLSRSDLTEGAVIFDKNQREKRDTATAKIYKQVPGGGGESTLEPGSSVDLYLSNDKSRIKGKHDDLK